MQFYRGLAAFLGWVGLALFFYATTAHKTGIAFLHGTVIYFSYFTILSNILVACCLTFAGGTSRSPIARFVARPGVRTAAAVYIIVTGVVYLIFLRKLSPPGNILFMANVLLHYVVPVMYLFDWFMFVPRRTLQWKQVLYWPAFPLLYAVYTFMHGALTGFYPYFFINVTRLGYAMALLNCVYLLAVFVILGSVLVAIDRRMNRKEVGRPHGI